MNSASLKFVEKSATADDQSRQESSDAGEQGK
jgi:hypothetical protein